MTTVHTYQGTLVVVECYKCGITFGIPKDKQRRLREDGDGFYCPNGHCQSYNKSEVQKLQDEITRKARRIENLESDVSYERDLKYAANNRCRAQRGVTTKLKNRIKNGVCPCCKRSFKNIENHIAMKHPGYAKKGE